MPSFRVELGVIPQARPAQRGGAPGAALRQLAEELDQLQDELGDAALVLPLGLRRSARARARSSRRFSSSCGEKRR